MVGSKDSVVIFKGVEVIDVIGKMIMLGIVDVYVYGL